MTQAISTRDKRLLIADDNEPYRAVLARSLRALGYAVSEAISGEDAVRQVLEQECGYFDAAVLDYSMGNMTGGEAANAMRAACPDQPVVFLSGHDLPPDLRSHEAVLQKPVLPEQIAEVVERLVSQRITLVPREP